MVIPRWLVAPLEEATGAGGTTTASAMRATRPRVAIMKKKYNNPLATSVGQSTTAKIQSRSTSMRLPQSTSGRKSTRTTTRGLLLKRGEGTILSGPTMMMTATASLPSPPTSPTSPTPKTSNQLESPSMTVSRTRAIGFVATPSPLKFQRDPTLQKLSTSRWLWSPHPSRGLKASSQTRLTHGRTQASLHRQLSGIHDLGGHLPQLVPCKVGDERDPEVLHTMFL
jgi:hypothetical protein